MVADPGLQPERTTMSWGRTMLSLIVIGSLSLRWAGTAGPAATIPSLIALTVVVGIHLTQRRRYRLQRDGIASSRGSANLAAVLLLGAAVVLVGLTQLGVLLLR